MFSSSVEVAPVPLYLSPPRRPLHLPRNIFAIPMTDMTGQALRYETGRKRDATPLDIWRTKNGMPGMSGIELVQPVKRIAATGSLGGTNAAMV